MADLCKLSASIVADSVERSYLLKVDGYSSAKQRFKTGECLASPLLSFRGYDWVLKYYPNGDSETGPPPCISLVVECSDAKDDLPVPAIRLYHKDELLIVPPYVFGPAYTQPFRSEDGLSSYYLFVIDREKLEQSGDIIDDCFSIRCVLLTEKTMGDQFVVLPPSDLHLHFGNLLESMDGADVTFLVGGERFSAHWLVLAARSSVFRAELHGPMKEKADNPIEIVGMEALVFKSLLHFIYTDSLPDLQMTHNKGEARPDVMMAGHLLVAADRYNVERLKLICEHKLCSHIDVGMVATSLALAEQHRCNGLKEACLKFLASPSNLEAMVTSDGYKHLKNSCPSALKELIARLLPANMKAAKDIVMEL